jgi:hypothetical protein
MRYAMMDGARKLHCDDDWAVSCPDGTKRAFVDGSPAVVVEFTGTDGTARFSALLPSRSWTDERASSEFGPDARKVQPTERHLAAIRAAAPSDRAAGTYPARVDAVSFEMAVTGTAR